MDRRWSLSRSIMLACLAFAAFPVDSHAGEAAEAVALRTKLNTIVEDFKGFDDTRTTLNEAFAFLSDKHRFTYVINEAAFLREKIDGVSNKLVADPVPVRAMKGVTLGQVFKAVLGQVAGVEGVELVIRRDHYEITTRVAVMKEFYPGRAEEPFPPLVHAVFKESPLDRALKELTDLNGGNVVLDHPGAKDAVKTPVTAEFSNVPLDTAVKLLADMAGLRTVTIDRVIYVTTKAKADALLAEQKGKKVEEPTRPRDRRGVLPRKSGK